jgi:hypothetical protein
MTSLICANVPAFIFPPEDMLGRNYVSVGDCFIPKLAFHMSGDFLRAFLVALEYDA